MIQIPLGLRHNIIIHQNQKDVLANSYLLKLVFWVKYGIRIWRSIGMLEMLDNSGILTAPGAGAVFLVVALICVMLFRKMAKAGTADKKPGNELNTGVSVPSQADEIKNTNSVIAAITAAVNEYRKSNL